jgi:VWFA-related protein
MRRAGLLGAVVLLAGAAVAAQQPQVPTFRSGVEVVRLDVTVLDKNRRPIRDLKQEDFTVTVDGVAQPLVAFDRIVMAPVDHTLAPWTRAVAADVRDNQVGEPRIFIIVLDDVSAPFHDLWMVRTGKEIARRIVDEMLPGDLAAVTFTGRTKYAQDLTNDRAKLLAAIDTFSSQSDMPGSIRNTQNTIRNLFSTMRQRAVGGRAALMWISTGSPNLERTFRIDRGFGERFEDPYSLITDINEIAREARVSNLPVYGFSIAGLLAPAPPFGSSPQFTYRNADRGNDVLRYIADRSGGRAVYNTNAPVRAVPDVIHELSAYYVLGYRATYPTTDNKTRRLRIKVNRPDAFVYPDDRPMMPPPRTKPPKMTPETPLLLAMSDILPQRGIPLRLAVTPVATDTKSRAAVALSLGVEQPAPDEPQTERVDVLTRIFTADGDAVTRLAHTADIKWAPTAESSRESQYEVLSRLDLKPGRYLLRTSVHSASRNKTGSVYADLKIPDFRKEPLSMSGVVLSATPGVRAVPKEAVAALLPIAPTAERQFSASQKVTAFVRVYQPEKKAPQQVTFRATITDAVGLDVWSHADTVPASRFSARRAADVTFALPLATLADGEYLMTITATTGEHRRELRTRFARK